MTETNHLPRRKRVVLCRGVYCNEGRRADALYRQLVPLLAEINAEDGRLTVKLETASCLSMCGAGPNLVIYPEGMACNGVDEAELKRIVAVYLR
jgi:(2Fe-2S) ferredoxin